ncbi:MAG: GNAT family N-acetyltransferase [Flavobacteriales bacterium]|nr:GNAT family N-acetyltransferase [Flavobacteriales bacterium]
MLEIRELTEHDIPQLLDYWFNSSPHDLNKMGADPDKIPSRETLSSMLKNSLNSPIEERSSYCLIWYLEDEPIGHCNTNPTTFGEEAYMHLHLWNPSQRRKGIGSKAVNLCAEEFFNKLKLKRLYSQPKSDNRAPNKVLEKTGFQLVKNYVTVPGSINYEQEVKLWVLEPQ